MSIDSLLGLYEELSRIYGVRYILTSRLNQDALESLFSIIRSYGGANTNPSPSEFRFRLRLILLGSKLKAPQNTNCEWSDENVSYMSANLLNQKILRNKDTNHSSKASTSELETPGWLTPEFDNNTIESLRYMAGYIAWKLKKHGKGVFGTPTDLVPLVDLRRDGWIERLSRGGLLIPTTDIQQTVETCESEFLRVFDVLKSEQRISSRLQDIILSKYPGFNRDVVKEFVHTRIKIRVRELNTNVKQKPAKNTAKNKQFLKSQPRN